MTSPRKRLRASRLALPLAVAWSCVSALGAGCSSGDVKTVTTVDCSGAPASAGQSSTASGGSQPSGGSGGAAEMAGEAGEPGASGAEAGAAQGGMNGGSGGSAVSGGASGGRAGAGAGVGGHAGNASGGANSSGGHGGAAGSSPSGGSSGAKPLSCGDKVVTPPEFCDDGTNTDLSYGCYSCTTLPPPQGGSGGAQPQQCDACLAQTPTKACYACQDHRACYACLRRQPSSFGAADACSNGNDDDVVGDYGIRRQLSDECFNPNDPIGSAKTGGPAGNATRGAVCQALIACALRTGCARGTTAGQPRTLFTGCYCGDGHGCTASTDTPTGPCVNEVRNAAAEPPGTIPTAEFADLGFHFLDADPANPWVDLGVVNDLLACANDGCASACYSSGSGGSGGGP